MSLDRRKPFARLQPNDSKPSEALPTPATATARLTISRPRRQMPAYHYQYQHHHQQQQQQQQYPQQKRYATMIPGSSRSSATSSAESLYSNTAGTSSVPRRRRKLSAAEDVAARVRARWAALEALERAGASSSSSSRSGGVSTAGYLHSAPAQRRRSLSVNNAEKENAALSMQVDAYEKPLPPHPPPPALTPLHISAPIPIPATTATAAGYSASADGHTVVAATATTVMMDTRLDDCAPMSAPATAAVTGPAPGESTVRTTPTSLTFVETDSSSPGAGLGPALQRRPTRAVTPPQVRRRASITDELEEAVSPPRARAKHRL